MNIPEEEIRKRVYAHNYEQWRDVCKVSRYSDRTLEVREVGRGILLPPILRDTAKGEFSGGVCDEGFHFVAGLFRNKPPAGGWFGVNESYSAAEEDVVYQDEDVIFGGVLIAHFGHFILECFGRLWYVLKNRKSVKRIAFVSVMGYEEWFYGFFELLGIPEERVLFIEKPTQFRSVTVPEESVHSWWDYTGEHLLPYRYMAQRARATERVRPYLHKKLFLTRSRLDSSETVCCNEKYFERFYVNEGFCVIAPESFTIEEQIAIFSHADEVVCVLGSLGHWALFCKPGTRFTMLARTNHETLASQCLVNEASGVDWRIVDVSMNFLYATRSFGVCLIGPTPYWKQFSMDAYGRVDEDDSWKYAYHEYLFLWCDFYLKNQIERLKRFDCVQMVQEMKDALCRNEPVDGKQGRNRALLACCARIREDWLPWTYGGICGDERSLDPIKSIRIYYTGTYNKLYYTVYSSGKGWGDVFSESQIAGIEGDGGTEESIYGIGICLDEEDEKNLSVRYRIHGMQHAWSNWASDGEKLFSRKVPINAFEVQLIERGDDDENRNRK